MNIETARMVIRDFTINDINDMQDILGYAGYLGRCRNNEELRARVYY